MEAREDKVVPGQPFRALVSFNVPYKWEYIGGALLALAFTGVELGAPLVLRAVVHLFEKGRITVLALWLLVLLLLGLAVVAGVARYGQRTLMIGASRKFEYDLRNAYFRRLQRLSRDFFNRTKTGDIMARATNDLNYVRLFVGPGVMGSVDMIRVPFTLAIMLYLNIKLTLIGLLPVPFLSLIVYAFVMYMHRQSRRVQEQFSAVTSRAQENLAGARVVKAYGAAERELSSFRHESEKYLRESLKLAYATALVWPLLELLVAAIIVLILWQGGIQVIHGTLTPRLALSAGGIVFHPVVFTLGDFSGFIFCLIMLAFPLAEFGWVLSLYQRGAAAMNRIIEIMAEEPTIRENETTRSDAMPVAGSVRFAHVRFRYDGRPVLEDVDFEIEAGQTVAVVGPTGSGKSTLVALITREYDPEAGEVLLDGISVRSIPLMNLRQRIACVPQDTFLFSDTIRANLQFGRPDASEEDLEAVCEMAQFQETVNALPDRYDTMLGERGVNLSGGQKQRLSLARALLRDAAVLILDDALSSVDAHTEEEILSRLRARGSRTCVLISHRVSTIRHADRILVLKDGRVVEQGTHEDLVERGGVYWEMYQRHLLEEKLEDA